VYVAYLRGFVVIVVGLVGAGVVVMRVVVMQHGRSLLRVMIRLVWEGEAMVVVVVVRR
jgi:hypothetical protein